MLPSSQVRLRAHRIQLESVQAAATQQAQRAEEAGAQLDDCRRAATDAQQAVADADAAAEAATDELAEAEEARPGRRKLVCDCDAQALQS